MSVSFKGVKILFFYVLLSLFAPQNPKKSTANSVHFTSEILTGYTFLFFFVLSYMRFLRKFARRHDNKSLDSFELLKFPVFEVRTRKRIYSRMWVVSTLASTCILSFLIVFIEYVFVIKNEQKSNK